MQGLRTRDLFALVGGAASLSLAPSLPPAWLSLALLAGALVLAWLCRQRPARLAPTIRFSALAIAGAAWVALGAALALERRLDPDLSGVDMVVEGHVADLPLQRGRAWRFAFVVEHAEHLDAGSLVRLSWYDAAEEPRIGARWRLTVRLRPPRGGANPGAFDFERHALERALAATGTVRAATRLAGEVRGVGAARERVAARIADVTEGSGGGALLRALAVGDRRAIDDARWETLRATGTSHLMAISGLHVGLVAGFGVLIGRVLPWLWPSLLLRFPARFWALLPALPLTVGYAALAGFAVPTQRALLMLLVAAAALLLRRNASALHVLMLAACSVLLVDPLAVLGASYWLSVLGVGALVLFARGRVRLGALGRLVQAQGVLALALLPFTLLFFGMLSLSGPLANLLAVPWVGLVAVPIGLVGAAAELLVEGGGDPLLRFATGCLEGIAWVLDAFASGRWAVAHLPEPSTTAWILALLGVLVLLLPRATPGKALGVLLLLPIVQPPAGAPDAGTLRLVMIDVGQGTAVLVQTHDRALLYDTGPAFPGGLDLGEVAVVPALRALGVTRLDAIVVSHADHDHAGGLHAVRNAFPEARVLASGVPGVEACLRGQGWQWDGLRVAVLHPPRHMPYLRNESSCVLSLHGPGGRVLLPGDIGRIVERRLVREQPEALPADILVVPHHGSGNASSAAFLDAVSPRVGLVSAGWRNRFGHPADAVVDRYAARNIALAGTAECGAWIVELHADGRIESRPFRRQHRRFWREPC